MPDLNGLSKPSWTTVTPVPVIRIIAYERVSPQLWRCTKKYLQADDVRAEANTLKSSSDLRGTDPYRTFISSADACGVALWEYSSGNAHDAETARARRRAGSAEARGFIGGILPQGIDQVKTPRAVAVYFPTGASWCIFHRKWQT